MQRYHRDWKLKCEAANKSLTRLVTVTDDQYVDVDVTVWDASGLEMMKITTFRSPWILHSVFMTSTDDIYGFSLDSNEMIKWSARDAWKTPEVVAKQLQNTDGLYFNFHVDHNGKYEILICAATFRDRFMVEGYQLFDGEQRRIWQYTIEDHFSSRRLFVNAFTIFSISCRGEHGVIYKNDKEFLVLPYEGRSGGRMAFDAKTSRLFVSLFPVLTCYDCITNTIVWETKLLSHGPILLSPCGAMLGIDGDELNIINASSGELLVQKNVRIHCFHTNITKIMIWDVDNGNKVSIIPLFSSNSFCSLLYRHKASISLWQKMVRKIYL